MAEQREATKCPASRKLPAVGPFAEVYCIYHWSCDTCDDDSNDAYTTLREARAAARKHNQEFHNVKR